MTEAKIAGWIAIYNGNKIEIPYAKGLGLYGAKLLAIKQLNVPKSKEGLVAIDVAYDD